MILLPGSVRVFFATEPTCLRYSFEGLSNLVRTKLEEDPVSGRLFVFINRRRNQVKLLLWTRGGFAILHKRLERGTFAFIKNDGASPARVEIDVHELAMMLEGINADDADLKPRWSPKKLAAPSRS